MNINRGIASFHCSKHGNSEYESESLGGVQIPILSLLSTENHVYNHCLGSGGARL